MEITREYIIERFKSKFKNNPSVYALWLEGADSTNSVDEFSDLDLWLDVKDERLEIIFKEIEGLLTEIGPLDFVYEIEHVHPKIRHKIFHLQDTSEFLCLDINLQCHSRNPAESEFVTGDPIESPQVIFDKADVIRFVPVDEIELQQRLRYRLYHVERTFSKLGLKRYVARNEFLEALAYYHKFVLQPLVELLRIRYTPLHHDYGPVHISRHLPKETVLALEELHKVATLEEVENKADQAERLFKDAVDAVKSEMLE